MRKTLAYALAVLALGTSPATSQPNNQPASLRSRVVLVTIDGMRPDFYLDERYPCPNLRRLCAEGSYADEVRPVFPSITYANHTSLVTGVPPRQHNILSNTIFQPPASATPGPTRAYNVESQKIKALPLWTRAHRQNLKVTSFSWPVTVGPISTGMSRRFFTSMASIRRPPNPCSVNTQLPVCGRNSTA